jgi:hypothetical protein
MHSVCFGFLRCGYGVGCVRLVHLLRGWKIHRVTLHYIS